VSSVYWDFADPGAPTPVTAPIDQPVDHTYTQTGVFHMLARVDDGEDMPHNVITPWTPPYSPVYVTVAQSGGGVWTTGAMTDQANAAVVVSNVPFPTPTFTDAWYVANTLTVAAMFPAALACTVTFGNPAFDPGFMGRPAPGWLGGAPPIPAGTHPVNVTLHLNWDPTTDNWGQGSSTFTVT